MTSAYDAPAMAKSTRASTPKGGASKISRIEIEPTDNSGFLATVYSKPSGNSPRAMMGAMMEPAKHSFADWDAAEVFLNKTFAKDEDKVGDAPAAEEPEEPKAPKAGSATEPAEGTPEDDAEDAAEAAGPSSPDDED